MKPRSKGSLGSLRWFLRIKSVRKWNAFNRLRTGSKLRTLLNKVTKFLFYKSREFLDQLSYYQFFRTKLLGVKATAKLADISAKGPTSLETETSGS
jgi:hypothetical protein